MKQTQPNFETIKKAFYKAFVDSDKANTYVSMESLCGKFLPGFHARKTEFKNDFIQWLDRLDIRQAGELILILKEQNKDVPKWAANWKYNIDYNENGMLDLIITDNQLR